MTRHSREDAISEQLFERLVDVSETLDEPYRSDCRFILFAAGRLGLRAGELCHIREDWIDWKQSIIHIPRHDPCDKGRHGMTCGYCRKRARSAVNCDDELTLEEAVQHRWEPKTRNSARAIPFDYSDRVKREIEAYFFDRDRYETSRATVNRRVDTLLEAADLPTSTCYPHSLRATAATFHAARLQAGPLQALFGWSKLGTAQKYVRLTGAQTQRALREAHAGD